MAMNYADDAQERQEKALTRAEWIAATALIISCGTGLYTAGIEVQRLNDQDRRLTAVEAVATTSATKLERIDANVSLLVEEAKERRERGK